MLENQIKTATGLLKEAHAEIKMFIKDDVCRQKIEATAEMLEDLIRLAEQMHYDAIHSLPEKQVADVKIDYKENESVGSKRVRSIKKLKDGTIEITSDYSIDRDVPPENN